MVTPGRIAVAALTLVCSGCGGSITPAQLERIAALESEIAGLEARAAHAQDVRDIKRLQRAYGYYLDRAMWDQLADLFAADGSIEIGLDGVYRGRERVRAYLYRLGGDRTGLRHGELNNHLQLQPVISIAADGRSARGRWRAFIMAGQHGERALWGEGPYENEYVKEHGVWRIRRLHWYQTFIVPYQGGWTAHADINGGHFVTTTDFPADAPPSAIYPIWPGVYTPPFHYPHPVTGEPVRVPGD